MTALVVMEIGAQSTYPTSEAVLGPVLRYTLYDNVSIGQTVHSLCHTQHIKEDMNGKGKAILSST